MQLYIRFLIGQSSYSTSVCMWNTSCMFRILCRFKWGTMKYKQTMHILFCSVLCHSTHPLFRVWLNSCQYHNIQQMNFKKGIAFKLWLKFTHIIQRKKKKMRMKIQTALKNCTIILAECFNTLVRVWTKFDITVRISSSRKFLTPFVLSEAFLILLSTSR
jgi:hypothetical protein